MKSSQKHPLSASIHDHLKEFTAEVKREARQGKSYDFKKSRDKSTIRRRTSNKENVRKVYGGLFSEIVNFNI
jgi:hypothetical protein